MDIQDEIISAMNTLIQKSLEKQNMCTTLPSVVHDISGNKYKVKISGSDFWVKSGTNITLKIGTPVWVHLPDGLNYPQKAFIMGYR